MTLGELQELFVKLECKWAAVVYWCLWQYHGVNDVS